MCPRSDQASLGEGCLTGEALWDMVFCWDLGTGSPPRICQLRKTWAHMLLTPTGGCTRPCMFHGISVICLSPVVLVYSWGSEEGSAEQGPGLSESITGSCFQIKKSRPHWRWFRCCGGSPSICGVHSFVMTSLLISPTSGLSSLGKRPPSMAALIGPRVISSPCTGWFQNGCRSQFWRLSGR